MRRGDAWAAYFRVELLTAEEGILHAAAHSMSLIRELKNVRELPQLDLDAETARQSIHTMMRLARQRLLGAETSTPGFS